jgi:catechol 2,3-dioxygenase-like lactoylglutathione lyase family enzyme
MPDLPQPPETLPGSLDLGVFSLSLAVADLEASLAFYEKLGFVEVGGSRDEDYLILKNGETTLGLFHGMFETNILTFNPGLTPRMEQLDDFTDVREIERRLKDAGLELAETAEGEEGPAHVSLVDPDGNPVLIDQFF